MQNITICALDEVDSIIEIAPEKNTTSSIGNEPNTNLSQNNKEGNAECDTESSIISTDAKLEDVLVLADAFLKDFKSKEVITQINGKYNNAYLFCCFNIILNIKYCCILYR